jgi:hypothetical protein
MKSAEGDSVVLHLPGGTEHLTVLEVSYQRNPRRRQGELVAEATTAEEIAKRHGEGLVSPRIFRVF